MNSAFRPRSEYVHRLTAAAVTGICLLQFPIAVAQAQKTLTSDFLLSGRGSSVDMGQFLGATSFYNAGYTGTRAIVANIEGGLFYHYSPALTNSSIVLDYGGPTPPPIGQSGVNDPNLANDPLWTQYDAHATAVAGVIASAPLFPGDNRAGIAYGATLVSGSVATNWIGAAYAASFDISETSFITPYVQALQTGISALDGRRANVVNGSYGYQDDSYANGGTAVSGADKYTVAFDGLARSSGATVVWAAGNNGGGGVNDPAAGFNGISVGALGFGAPEYGMPANPFSTIAGFSSIGPSDFLIPGTTLPVAGAHRATVDLVAPGEFILTLAYAGATGGNITGSQPALPVPNSIYGGFENGTSFAAPIVAGAASLLCDVGYDRYGGGNAINGNVIKAVLLNSADKISGWDNHQTTSAGGVITTTQALDFSSGAGAVDIGRSFTQYTAGTTNVSNGSALAGPASIAATGWDYGFLAPDASQAHPFNDYYFATSLLGGTNFTATLTWFIDRTYNGLDSSGGSPSITSSDLRFTNLDLELWRMANGQPAQLVAISSALYISTQQFSFALPDTGDYMLRVGWAGDQYNFNNSDAEGQHYGLAWAGSAASTGSAPDAATLLLMLPGGTLLGIAVLRPSRPSSR